MDREGKKGIIQQNNMASSLGSFSRGMARECSVIFLPVCSSGLEGLVKSHLKKQFKPSVVDG